MGVNAVMIVIAPLVNPKLMNQPLVVGCKIRTEKIAPAAAVFAANVLVGPLSHPSIFSSVCQMFGSVRW